MKTVAIPVCAALMLVPMPLRAQDEGSAEVIVTAMRRESDDYVSEMPAVGLRRIADFAVQEVTVSGDTRDKARRESEIYDMVKGAIAAAERSGVQLAFGERTLQPLTITNYRNLTLKNDSRPDSERTSFLVKTPLGKGIDGQTAQARITAFIKSVKPVGRAQIEESEDLTLSIVAPDQYRGAVAEAIAADARRMAGRFGEDYAVEVEGLNRPVEWARAGLSDVLLYIPYKLVVRPRR